MKKVAIMQPYLFPYVGYFQLMNAVDEYVAYDDVQFIKGGWINRNHILVNGEKVLFSIALKGASSNKLINEISINDDFQKFQKTISMAYGKAPYVEPVSALIERICSYKDKNLAKFIGNSLQEVARYIGIETNFVYSSELEKDNALKGQEKVIAICKELETDAYLNAIGGQELYSKEKFEKYDIKLNFLKPEPPEYKQFNRPFIPGLSIIDVMMFNSTSEIRKMLRYYELI